MLANRRDDDIYSRRDNRRRLGVISETESVGGGTRKDVETRVSLIRHFINVLHPFFFLRVSDRYPYVGSVSVCATMVSATHLTT